MTTTRHPHLNVRPLAVALVGFVVVVSLAACGSSSNGGTDDTTTTKASTSKGTSGELVGTFGIDAASCTAAGAPTGSYFRMVKSGGNLDAGPFVDNADSSCTDKSYTALAPGTDGGLVTGSYQEQPDPPFDAAGKATAGKIVTPTAFFGAPFAVSTNPTDPASKTKVATPVVSVADGKLTGNVGAVSVAWNGQQFNQGAPKPDGSKPGSTTDLSGTYDAKTGAYTIEWASQIVGGPFDGFTGVWHLEGTFEAS
jgi:hypothetical protein